MYLFQLSAQHMGWLAQRQSTTAMNVANANTPGYRAQDIATFTMIMNQTAPSLTTTSGQHLEAEASGFQGVELTDSRSWDSAHSGNNVSIENELLKAGETGRMMSLDAGVTRSFHRMFLSSVRV